MNAPFKPPIDVHSLLRLDEGLVHADVYANQAVFELEMEKIYHRGWVYVGHESEIPKPGDYITRWIGTHSVIMNRDDAGKLHLFLNRCRHRAVTVCQEERGNTRRFNCDYHGWAYKTSGELIGMPLEAGAYGPDFRRENYPLLAVPRLAVYRGFVWGSLSPSGISLMDHLGEAGKRSIDLFCDASPEGEVVLQQGYLRGVIYANWKFQGGDGYHPPIAHQANFMYYRGKRKGNNFNPVAVNGSIEEGFMSRDLGNGHCALDFRSVAKDKLGDAPWAKKYRKDMIRVYGKERAEFLIRTGGNPHTVFMPNLHLVNTSDLRVIRPIAVDHFELYFFCAFLKGVPHELNLMRMRDVEDRTGPAGCINPDDVEMFERNQMGMRQAVDPWKVMSRGIAREQIDADLLTPEPYRRGGTLVAHLSDEVTQRAQLRWWAEQLSQP